MEATKAIIISTTNWKQVSERAVWSVPAHNRLKVDVTADGGWERKCRGWETFVPHYLFITKKPSLLYTCDKISIFSGKVWHLSEVGEVSGDKCFEDNTIKWLKSQCSIKTSVSDSFWTWTLNFIASIHLSSVPRLWAILNIFFCTTVL